MKKALSLILAVVLCLSVFSVTAFAYTFAGGLGNLTWYYNSSTCTLTVTGNGSMPKVKDASITTWYGEKYKSSIKNLVIGTGVTSIASYAFENMTSLKTVYLPDNVTYAGEGAFSGCTSLQAVKLSSKMTSIPAKMFYGCRAIENLTIPEGITKIGNSSLAGCFTSLELPSGIKTIGEAAFCGCPLLSEITLPESVTAIGADAFAYCPYLKEITAEGTECDIGSNAFGKSYIETSVAPEEYFDALSEESTAEAAKIKMLDEPVMNSSMKVILVPDSAYEVYCTENGVSYGYVCEHEYDNYFVYRAPTVSVRGIERHICNKCGKTEDRYTSTSEYNVAFDPVTGAELRWNLMSEIQPGEIKFTAAQDTEDKYQLYNYFDNYFIISISAELCGDGENEGVGNGIPDDLVVMIPYERYLNGVEKVYEFREEELKLVKVRGIDTDDGYVSIPYEKNAKYVIVGSAPLNDSSISPEYYMFSYEALFAMIIKIIEIAFEVLLQVTNSAA